MSKLLKSMIKQDYEEKMVKVPKGDAYLDPETAQEIAVQLLKGQHIIRGIEQESCEGYRAQTVTVKLAGGYTVSIQKERYNEMKSVF